VETRAYRGWSVTIVAGAFDWDWSMNHAKARSVCSMCGRGGARIFYIVIESAFVVFGVLFAAGVMRDFKRTPAVDTRQPGGFPPGRTS
jgi:hypothetical protein